MKNKLRPAIIALAVLLLLAFGCVKNTPPVRELAEEDPAEYDNGPEVERPIDWGSEEEWIDQDDREIPENTAVRAEPAVRVSGSPAMPDLVNGLEIGRGTFRRGVTVFPLIQRTWPGSDALATLDQSAGRLLITDRAPNRDEIGRIYVDNNGRAPVMLSAGELLVGGMQNRIVAMDLIIPAGTRDFPVPVFSAEANRWSLHQTRERFVSSRDVSPAPIRYTIYASPRQSLPQRNNLIHREINELLNYYDTKSGTEDLSTLYARGELPRLLQCFHYDFSFYWPRRTVGYIVMSDRKILGIEIFPNSQAFQANWRKTLDGILAGRAVLDQACRYSGGEPSSRAAAQAALNSLLRAQLTSPLTGMTRDEKRGQARHLRVASQYLKGMALLEGADIVHLSVLGPMAGIPKTTETSKRYEIVEDQCPESGGFACYWYHYTYWYGCRYCYGYPYRHGYRYWHGYYYRPYWAYWAYWPYWPYWPYWAYYPPYPPPHRPPHDHPDHDDDPGPPDDPRLPDVPAGVGAATGHHHSPGNIRRGPSAAERRVTRTRPAAGYQAERTTGDREMTVRRPARPAGIGAKPEVTEKPAPAASKKPKPKAVKKPARVESTRRTKPPVARQIKETEAKTSVEKTEQPNKQKPSAADQPSGSTKQPETKPAKITKPKKPAAAKPAKSNDQEKKEEKKKKKKQ